MDTLPLGNGAGQPKPGLEVASSNHQNLSKKAQKRAAKAARLHELRLGRRAREKEARKHKRRERAKAIANGELDEESSRKRRKRDTGGPTEIFDANIVVDLGFDELMSDKEITSLTSQLAYTYSANRHTARAFSILIFASLNGRTKQRLDAMNDAAYRRWSRTEWWEEGYDRLWAEPQVPGGEVDTWGSLALPRADHKSIVYLTADSSEELLELKEGETYIIGGICDHNRYKNLCLNKANNSGVRHARLPIGRYVSLATRKILTVNQVFQILLTWIDTRSWEEAFWAVIPKRKFQGGLQGQGQRVRNEIAEQDDDDDDDEHDTVAGDGETMGPLGEMEGREIEDLGDKNI